MLGMLGGLWLTVNLQPSIPQILDLKSQTADPNLPRVAELQAMLRL